MSTCGQRFPLRIIQERQEDVCSQRIRSKTIKNSNFQAPALVAFLRGIGDQDPQRIVLHKDLLFAQRSAVSRAADPHGPQAIKCFDLVGALTEGGCRKWMMMRITRNRRRQPTTVDPPGQPQHSGRESAWSRVQNATDFRAIRTCMILTRIMRILALIGRVLNI